MKLQRVAVLGLGKVGSLVSTLLHRSGFSVTGFDASPPTSSHFPTQQANLAEPTQLTPLLQKVDAVVSCLPYNLNLAVAKTAHQLGIHYFDLTEDVPTTQTIQEISSSAKGVMAPQCGLAPGFIGIVGAHLARGFSKIRSIELRVGALPKHPRGKLGYAFNWSPEGVINQYLNDCAVIRNGQIQLVPALGGLETILINGLVLEAFTTSGGIGTMCETFAGKVDELNYKTIRYPGHYEQMRFLLNELYLRQDRQLAGKILSNALPAVDEDVVFVHAAVEGIKGSETRLVREEFVRAYPAIKLAGQSWRAISWTTAASVCAVVELVAQEKLPQQGFIRQENIPFDDFLATQNGQIYQQADQTAGGLSLCLD